MLARSPVLLAAALCSALLFLAAAVPTPAIASFSDACDCPKPDECDKHSCPAGCTYRPATRHCIPAPAGFYAPLTNETSSNYATPCPAGTYNPSAGSCSASACLACPAGTYSSAVASIICTVCPPGFCCPYSGMVKPIPCQSTQDCPQGSFRCPSAILH